MCLSGKQDAPTPRQQTVIKRRFSRVYTAGKKRMRYGIYECRRTRCNEDNTIVERGLISGQDVAGDDEALNLAGALVDLRDLGVAEVSL